MKRWKQIPIKWAYDIASHKSQTSRDRFINPKYYFFVLKNVSMMNWGRWSVYDDNNLSGSAVQCKKLCKAVIHFYILLCRLFPRDR